MPASIELKRRLRWADADAAGRLHFPASSKLSKRPKVSWCVGLNGR
jgi:hypothetical protein